MAKVITTPTRGGKFNKKIGAILLEQSGAIVSFFCSRRGIAHCYCIEKQGTLSIKKLTDWASAFCKELDIEMSKPENYKPSYHK